MKRALVLYFLSEIFLSTGIGIVQYALPFYYASAHASDSVIGILLGINSMIGGVAALLLGSLADRIGASRVFKLATLGLGLSYLLMSLWKNIDLWMVLSCASGLSGAMLMSTENVVLSSLTKSQEKAGVLSKFVSMYMFVMGAGAVVSGILAAAYGYQTAMWIGAATALVAPCIRVFVRAPDAIAHRAFRMPSRRIWLMSLYTMVFGLGYGLFGPFATLVLHTTFRLSTHATAVVSALSMFMVSLGSLMVSFLIRSVKTGPTLFISYAASVALTLGMAAMTGPWRFAGLYLARTATTSIPGPIVDATFLNLTAATEYSQMFGVRVFGNNVGSAMGSYLGGILLGHRWLEAMLVASAIAYVIAYIYLLILLRKTATADATHGAEPIQMTQ